MDDGLTGTFAGTFATLIILLILYLIPAIVGRKKKNATAILVMNLFLGWSVIGWIIALIWATTKD